jgi:ATP-dependent DNA ligase
MFNAQQQRRIRWPAHPSVARAYLDQLTRSDALRTDQTESVTDALGRVLTGEPRNGVSVADELDTIATEFRQRSETATGRTQTRFRALAGTLSELAERLQ